MGSSLRIWYGMHWFVESPLAAIPAPLKKWVGLWSPSCNVFHCRDLSTFWTWSCLEWFQCSLRASLADEGLLPRGLKNVLREVTLWWSTLCMSAKCFGRGRTLCMSLLPGAANRSYCWQQRCYRIAAQSLSKWRLDLPMINKGLRWGCEKEILCLSTFGVELSTTNACWLLLPLTLATVNLGKVSINFGDMSLHCAPILRGCLNSWHVPIAVQPWTCNRESHMEKCTTCRDRSPTFSILWCSKTSITLGTPKVPKSWKSSCACPGSDWDCVVGSNVLTVCTPKDPGSAESFSLQHWSYCGLQSE